MNILFYRYGNICEPDIINVLTALGINVIEEKTEITDKNLRPSQIGKLVNDAISSHHPLFVFSINFFPVIADVCHIHNILYLCWTVDCPVLELFSQSIQHPTNRIFMFDRSQYNRLVTYNPNGIYHLPLASSVERFDHVISTITENERQKFTCDISFVGSLYSEKNPLKKLDNIPPYLAGYIDSIVNSSLQVHGYNFMENALSDDVVATFKKITPDLDIIVNPVEDTDKFIIAHKYIGFHASEIDRIRTLNLLAEYFKVDLYTSSDASSVPKVRTHGAVGSLNEMPKIFHLSKINLNLTMKPIQSGLPLRIFDIMGCGGFCLTNYQEEISDYFEIGKDLETYSSLEELIEKCAFYLENDDIRREIAIRGYEKVRQYHTYPLRITEMIRIASDNTNTKEL